MQNHSPMAWLSEITPPGKVAPFPRDQESTGQFLEFLQSEPADQSGEVGDVSLLVLMPGIPDAPKTSENQLAQKPAEPDLQTATQVLPGADQERFLLLPSGKSGVASPPTDTESDSDIAATNRESKDTSVSDRLNTFAQPRTTTMPEPSHWMPQSSGSSNDPKVDLATFPRSVDPAHPKGTEGTPVAPIASEAKEQSEIKQAPPVSVSDIKSPPAPRQEVKILPEQPQESQFRPADEPEVKVGSAAKPAEGQIQHGTAVHNSAVGKATMPETSPVSASPPVQNPEGAEGHPQNAVSQTPPSRRDITDGSKDGHRPAPAEAAAARGIDLRKPALPQNMIAEPDAPPSSNSGAFNDGAEDGFTKPELSLEPRGQQSTPITNLQEPAILQQMPASLGNPTTNPETIQHFLVASRAEGGFSVIVEDGPGVVSQVTTSGPTVPSREVSVPAFQLQQGQPAPGPQISVTAQIAQAISTANRSEIEVRLSPEELGSVRIVMAARETGVHVTVFAEKADTLDLLKRDEAGFSADLDSFGFSGSNLTFSHETENNPVPEPDVELSGEDPTESQRMVILHHPSDRSGLDLRL